MGIKFLTKMNRFQETLMLAEILQVNIRIHNVHQL